MKYVIEIITSKDEIMVSVHRDSLSGRQYIDEAEFYPDEKEAVIGHIVKLLVDLLG